MSEEFEVRSALARVRNMVIAGVVVLGAAGWLAQNRVSEGLDGVELSAGALRSHMRADMMHDALRGDVLRALNAAAQGDTEGLKASQMDLKEHIAAFNASVDENNARPLAAEIKDALADVGAPLKAYTESASQLVTIAAADADRAHKMYSQFQSAFEHLEVKMQVVSDLIEERAAETAGTAHRWQWIGALLVAALGTVLVVGLAMYLRRFSAALMSALGAEPSVLASELQHVAAGDLKRPLPHASEGDVSAMAALSRMQTTIRDFLVAVKTLANEHVDAGRASRRIDVDGFGGDYKELALRVNELLGFHVTLQERLVSSMESYSQGEFSEEFPPLRGELARINGVVDSVRDELQRVAVESRSNQRIRSALDGCTTNVMIADPDGNIVYMNRSVGEMLSKAETDLCCR